MTHSDDYRALLDDAFEAYERGDLARTAKYALAALEIQADEYDAVVLLGLVALRKLDFTSAQKWFAKATVLDPDHPEAHTNLGLASFELGDVQGALTAFNRALSIDPASTAARFGRGMVFRSIGQLEKAEPDLRVAASGESTTDAALYHANVLLELGNTDEAAIRFAQVLSERPDDMNALAGHAKSSVALGRFAEALADYDAILEQAPTDVEALNNRGSALLQLRRRPEAVTAFERARAEAPRNVSVLTNCSEALRQVFRHDEALRCAEDAVRVDPRHAIAHLRLGSTLMDLGRLDDAAASLARAAELDPTNPEVRCVWAWNRLLAGDWKTGFDLFEARFEGRMRIDDRTLAVPRWRGDFDLAGRTILLHAEQGLGDTIMCARYARRVEALGARVILEVQPALKAVLARIGGASAHVVGRDECELPPFDCHCPLMSLPLAFRTTPDSVPPGAGYLEVPHANVRALEARLGSRNRYRVGLAWSGNPSHIDDRLRSLPLRTLMHALSPSATYYCLQKEIQPTDRDALSEPPSIVNLHDVLQNFADTAALIQQMDLVIAVDTSIAHLSAALGKPTWILLSKRPDWRWLLDRDDSCWYASVRLFRQSDWGDWSTVLGDVRRALDARSAMR